MKIYTNYKDLPKHAVYIGSEDGVGGAAALDEVVAEERGVATVAGERDGLGAAGDDVVVDIPVGR